MSEHEAIGETSVPDASMGDAITDQANSGPDSDVRKLLQLPGMQFKQSKPSELSRQGTTGRNDYVKEFVEKFRGYDMRASAEDVRAYEAGKATLGTVVEVTPVSEAPVAPPPVSQ